MWGYGQETDRPLTARSFWIDVMCVLQKYHTTAEQGILIGNWAEQASEFEKILSPYVQGIDNDCQLIQVRDLTLEFADGLQSTYHAVTRTFVGGWLADTLSQPFGGGGSTLKKSLTEILEKYAPLFKEAEEKIQRENQLKQARQDADDAQAKIQALRNQTPNRHRH